MLVLLVLLLLLLLLLLLEHVPSVIASQEALRH